MSLEDISYLELWRPICSVQQKHLHNFGTGHHLRNNSMKLLLIWTSGSGVDVV